MSRQSVWLMIDPFGCLDMLFPVWMSGKPKAKTGGGCRIGCARADSLVRSRGRKMSKPQ